MSNSDWAAWGALAVASGSLGVSVLGYRVSRQAAQADHWRVAIPENLVVEEHFPHQAFHLSVSNAGRAAVMIRLVQIQIKWDGRTSGWYQLATYAQIDHTLPGGETIEVEFLERFTRPGTAGKRLAGRFRVDLGDGSTVYLPASIYFNASRKPDGYPL
jgi:hypothetical protein